MARIRTAKALARRIDLQYFKRLAPLRRWRLMLSIAVPLIAGVWLLGERATGNQNVYTSGPLSLAHSSFATQCNVCHVRKADYRAHVPDAQCVSCHDAPVHSAQQTFTPACSSCHVEHQGRVRLAATGDSGCTQCHADLHTTDGKRDVELHVAGFDSRHPQFAALRAGYKDPGTINVNHFVHLQPTLRGPHGPVQMQCDDCHRFGTAGPWPYAVDTVQPATQKAVVINAATDQQRKRREVEPGGGAYAAPIKYVDQCAACHLLQFDALIPEPAPHDKPEVVRAFILQKLTAYVAANPSVVSMPYASNLPGSDIEPQRGILRPTDAPAPAAERLTPQQWITQRAAAAERLLWSKNCRLCHARTEGEEGVLPTKVTAVIPTRWMARSEFDHGAHRMMACTACHTHIPQSRGTSDINLPSIELCRTCHKEAGRDARAVEGRCFECHAYHDWRKEKPTRGKFDVVQLRGSGPAATPITSTPSPR